MCVCDTILYPFIRIKQKGIDGRGKRNGISDNKGLEMRKPLRICLWRVFTLFEEHIDVRTLSSGSLVLFTFNLRTEIQPKVTPFLSI